MRRPSRKSSTFDCADGAHRTTIVPRFGPHADCLIPRQMALADLSAAHGATLESSPGPRRSRPSGRSLDGLLTRCSRVRRGSLSFDHLYRVRGKLELTTRKQVASNRRPKQRRALFRRGSLPGSLVENLEIEVPHQFTKTPRGHPPGVLRFFAFVRKNL